MAFANAMDSRIIGENGAPSLATTGSKLLDLHTALVRGLSTSALEGLFAAALKEAITVEAKADFVILAFQTRAARDGKGERRLFHELLRLIWSTLGEEAVVAVLPLVPTMGYWKDLSMIIALESTPAAVEGRCLDIMAEALREDEAELNAAAAADRKPLKLSLVGKWAPREHSAHDATASKLAVLLYGSANKAAARRKYRKLVSALNAALGTTEVLMAAKRWAEIRFAHVASTCLARHRKAFLNERLREVPSRAQAETGNRHPRDAARVAARRHLRAQMASKRGVKGRALSGPHEIVARCMIHMEQQMVMAALGDDMDYDRRGLMSDAEGELVEAQWADMRDGVRASLLKAEEQRARTVLAAAAPAAAAVGGGDLGALRSTLRRRGVDMGKVVALVDVSGSMTGAPMEAAIGLGILTSELAAPAFRDRVLTFEAKPRWVDLSGCGSLRSKVEALAAAPWGGSTDFAAACEHILAAVQAARLSADEIPDLLVLSDMAFDEAHGEGHVASWATHHERLQRRFAEVGVAVCGQPYPPPRILYWNLRAAGAGFAAAADAPGTQLLSGFSPAMIKLVLAGHELVLEEETLVTAERRGGPTPLQTLRAALDDAAFHPVRSALSALPIGPLAAYRWPPAEGGREPEEEAAEEEDGFELVGAEECVRVKSCE